MFKFLIKTHVIEGFIGLFIYFVCPLFAGGSQNYYTANHLQYNQLVAYTLIKWDMCLLLGILLKDNIGHSRWTKLLCQIIFSIARFYIVVCMVIFVLPFILKCFVETWRLNSRNWWVSKEENFFSSDSKFNALVCWIIWSILIVIENAFLLYVTILIILALALIKDSGIKYFMMFLTQEVFLLSRGIFGRTLCFIFGLTYIGPFSGRQTDDDYSRAQKYEVDRKKRIAFLAKETKQFGEIFKVKDCPVCLEDFTGGDSIVQLKCNE